MLYNIKKKGFLFIDKYVEFYDPNINKIISGSLKKQNNYKEYEFYILYTDKKDGSKKNDFLSDRYKKNLNINNAKPGEWRFVEKSGKNIVEEYNKLKSKYT